MFEYLISNLIILIAFFRNSFIINAYLFTVDDSRTSVEDRRKRFEEISDRQAGRPPIVFQRPQNE